MSFLKLSKERWIKILKGAGLAGAGAVVVYLLENTGEMDFGQYTPLAVGLISVFLNYLRKVIEEAKEKKQAT